MSYLYVWSFGAWAKNVFFFIGDIKTVEVANSAGSSRSQDSSGLQSGHRYKEHK